MRIFKEEQRFTQPLILVILIMSGLVVIGLTTKEYMAENSNMKTVEFITVLGGYFAFTLPIFFFKLITRIDEKGIHYRFFPFHRKFRTLFWPEIKTASVRKYDAISEYGGWGLKGFFGKRGRAINVKGDIGIQLYLTNAKAFLIGTQKENEAKSVLETYKHKLHSESE